MMWNFLLAFLFSFSAYAFPEMTTHGYTHCTACHTSVVGGNLMSSYGRALSKDHLSQPDFLKQVPVDGDEKILHGLYTPPEELNLGGDLRLLQTFTESKTASKGRFLIMQVQLNSELQTRDREFIFASIGRMEPKSSDASAKDFIYFPQFGYRRVLSAEDSPTQESVRIGRFAPAYGINFQEHVFFTRTLLEFGPGQERLAAEYSALTDKYALVATAILNQFNGNNNVFEQGGVLQISSLVGENSKIGGNYYLTQRKNGEQSYQREIMGVFAYLGFSADWYGLIEIDRPKNSSEKYGFVETAKFGHFMQQGLQFYFLHEFANLDTAQSDPKLETLGIGIEWMPRPHFDFYAAYRKEKNTAIDKDYQDVVWLLGHYYL